MIDKHCCYIAGCDYCPNFIDSVVGYPILNCLVFTNAKITKHEMAVRGWQEEVFGGIACFDCLQAYKKMGYKEK